MAEQTKRQGLLSRAVETLQIPGEVAGFVQVTVTGARQVLVENHRGLLAYSREEVLLGCRRGRVRVRGYGLDLRTMTASDVLIVGDIFGVDFERGDET